MTLFICNHFKLWALPFTLTLCFHIYGHILFEIAVTAVLSVNGFCLLEELFFAHVANKKVCQSVYLVKTRDS